MKQERIELDVKKRNEIIRKITDILEKESPRVPLTSSNTPFVIKKKLKGFPAPAGGGWGFGVMPYDNAWISA